MSDKYNSIIASVIGNMNGSTDYAVTISSTCTLYSVPREYVDAKWRKHEDIHKEQIKKTGWLKFMYRYLKYSIKYGYTNNPYEQEARGEVVTNW